MAADPKVVRVAGLAPATVLHVVPDGRREHVISTQPAACWCGPSVLALDDGSLRVEHRGQ